MKLCVSLVFIDGTFNKKAIHLQHIGLSFLCRMMKFSITQRTRLCCKFGHSSYLGYMWRPQNKSNGKSKFYYSCLLMKLLYQSSLYLDVLWVIYPKVSLTFTIQEAVFLSSRNWWPMILKNGITNKYTYLVCQ